MSVPTSRSPSALHTLHAHRAGAQPASTAKNNAAVLPLGAMLLAGSFGAWAQTTGPAEATLNTVTVTEHALPAEAEAKATLRATVSTVGKGQQTLRDIPQTVTVMTELLLTDRNLDDFREVLKTTAGVTFMAGETGEEDVRLRGFSLGQAGDIYVDSLRDAPLMERDTFNLDRVEVLKGSASMLFGKGSTGGVVNQVSKQPFLMNQHEVSATVGSGQELRLTGDFNLKTGDDAALRINAMTQQADHHGATVDKKGLASTYRWGIGLKDEFSVGLYHLETNGTPLYNHPWFLSEAVSDVRTVIPFLPAGNYYGLASDHLKTESNYLDFSHKHRFSAQSELKTTVRHGHYERDLWASVVRFASGTSLDNINGSTVMSRTPKGRVGASDLTQIQSDFTNRFELLGSKHDLIAGLDLSLEDAQRNNSFAGDASGLNTTVGTPNNGDSRADTRGTPVLNTFKTSNLGLYAQDTVSLSDTFKLIGGLRYDRFQGRYRTNTCDPVLLNGVTEGVWSPRLGAIYQPNGAQSYYASVGTSYNTSGDTYAHGINVCTAAGSNNARLVNTPPEKSRNLEVGGKFELFEDKASLGVALFRSEKYNERNTDEPTADSYLLSGKRHATGMEFNLAGRITPAWDVFYNHTWIPSAQIDHGTLSGNAQREGDRPALTPKHSASLWTTYRVLSQLRLGLGLNHRGEQNPEGNRTVVAPAFTTVDVMAEYQVSDSASLKLNVSNLTDKLYADSLYRGFYVPGAARTVQLTLKTLF